MRPFSTNAAVVGRVTPSESPTLASEGPASVKLPSTRLKLSTSTPLPSKLKRERPALSWTVSGTADAASDDATSGNTPAEVAWNSNGSSL